MNGAVVFARKQRIRMVTLLLPALLAGCAVGPDFNSPPAPAVDALGASPATTSAAPGPFGAAQLFQADADISAVWWQLFQSPALNHLIDEALAHNADLEAAQASLRVARETASANLGVFYPNLQGTAQALRQKDPTASVQPTAANNAPILNLFTPQLSVSYVPDLWGGNRRAQESLAAQSEAQRFQTEATRLTLTSNVVVAAILEASLRGQVEATQRIVALESESLDILNRQLDLGQVAEADRLGQETALALAQETLPPLLKQLEQQRHQLTALLGRLPAEAPTERVDLIDLQLPTTLPAALPSRLVEQRPDIRMAEANLQSASALIGVAIANRLPNVTLDGALGSSATTLQQLFKPGTGFWSFGATASQPLFDGFSLLHKERAARAAYDQAAAQYRSTVITAFQNVADCLQALQSDADALRAALVADHAADGSLAIARRQLELGAIGYLALLNAEQSALQARIALVQAEASRLADTAALFLALGGGWWNRSPPSDS
jgi:NodT family efflux transporter outer membrane factor (OMF) lipoprotein